MADTNGFFIYKIRINPPNQRYPRTSFLKLFILNQKNNVNIKEEPMGNHPQNYYRSSHLHRRCHRFKFLYGMRSRRTNRQPDRVVRYLIIHCSAGHKKEDAVFHFHISASGHIRQHLPLSEAGRHTHGLDRCSIGICYEGGSDADGNPKDTRTRHQCEAMNALVTTLQQVFPKIIILGHNQLKVYGGNACPCFDVQKEWMSKK